MSGKRVVSGGRRIFWRSGVNFGDWDIVQSRGERERSRRDGGNGDRVYGGSDRKGRATRG